MQFIDLMIRVYRRLFVDCFVPVLGLFLSLLPIKKNRIIFDNFSGKGYADNPKYIAEQFIKDDLKWELIWLVDGKNNKKFPIEIKPVEIYSFKSIYYRVTAKVWIHNTRNVYTIIKRKDQIYLQTGHGPFGPKCVEKDAADKLPKRYVKMAKHDGSITDAIISNSLLQTNRFKSSFWLNEKTDYLEFGLPRNDSFIKKMNDINISKKLRRLYGFDEEAYIILYAPTFRDDRSVNGYMLDFKKIIGIFEEKICKKCYLIVRFHPNVENYQNIVEFNEYTIDGKIIDDLQDLSLISDCIISDYSTCLFDFALQNKPAYICALDFEEYKKKRGLLIDEFFALPFSISFSNEELIEAIQKFNYEQYKEKLKLYFNEYPIYDNGNASIKTVEWIKRKIY